MIRFTTSRLILAASLFAGTAAAQAQQAATTGAGPSTGDPGQDTPAEARAGQAPMGEADAQQSANAQNPVPPASVNEQVKEADPDTVCDTKKRKPTPACEASERQDKEPKPK